MNIQNDLQNLQPVPDTAGVDRSERAAPQEATSGSQALSDQTHLSPAANMAMQAGSLPDVRMEKVTGVQAALGAGTYNVSSSDVAEKLIGHMLENKG